MNFNSFSHLLTASAGWQAGLKWWILSELIEYIRGKASIWYSNAMHRLMNVPPRQPASSSAAADTSLCAMPCFLRKEHKKRTIKFPFLSSLPESIAECFPPFWHRTHHEPFMTTPPFFSKCWLEFLPRQPIRKSNIFPPKVKNTETKMSVNSPAKKAKKMVFPPKV